MDSIIRTLLRFLFKNPSPVSRGLKSKKFYSIFLDGLKSNVTYRKNLRILEFA